MRKLAPVIASVAAALASATVVSAFGPTPGPPEDSVVPADDLARGLVFGGLTPGEVGHCAGGFEIAVDGQTYCTHGPDAGPDGVDVRTPRGVAELKLATLSLPSVANGRAGEHAPVGSAAVEEHVHADGSVHDHAAAAGSEAAAAAVEEGIIPVIGDGVSGNRVQAVYVVASDQVDRYDEVAPLIANWAAHVDAMLNASAGLTGGERHVRFVTDASGALVVQKVVVPPVGDDTFSDTIQAMRGAGHADPSRKYLMWTDTMRYCGIATIYGDDKPTADNYNNGRFPMYSRVDAGCWGKSSSVELHEIVHNFGGVQQSAPHVTPGWHCTDDADRMCYKDSSTVTMTYACESWMEAYLDCGHDDYFHTSPPAGSYLSAHWNVADSSFLHVGPPDGGTPPPPPVNVAPVVSVSGPSTVVMGVGAVLDGSVTDDGLPGPYTVTWSQASGPSAMSFVDQHSEDTTVSFSVAGTYGIRLVADDGEAASSAVLWITVEEPAPVNEAPTVAVSGPSTVALDAGALLDGSVSDDGLPSPYSVQWSQASGPGVAKFGDTSAEDTSVSFSTDGTYGLRLVATDGEQSSSALLSISVEAPPAPPPVNEAPTVSVSAPSTVVLGDGAALDGSVSDDGLPGPYSVQWSQVSGPGATSFGDLRSEDTSVSFTAAGTFVLALVANDGESTSSSSTTIVVTEPSEPVPTVEQLSGSLNKRWSTRTFELPVGDGMTTSALTASTSGGGAGGKGKNSTSANEAVLTLTIVDATGHAVGTATESGQLSLQLELPAGSYSWIVSGTASNFELLVTHF